MFSVTQKQHNILAQKSRWLASPLILAKSQLFVWPAFLMLICLAASKSSAQIDPSSALLLNGSARSSSRDNGVDSGRYTVRPRSDASRTRTSTDESAPKSRLRTVDSPTHTESATPVESDGPVGSLVQVQAASVSKGSTTAPVTALVRSAPAVVEAPGTSSNQSPGSTTHATTHATTPASSKGMNDHERSVELSTSKSSERSPEKLPERAVEDSQADDDAIRQQVARDREASPKAPQNNLLDLSFSAGYLYNDSSSTYSFRKYSTSAPAIHADARIWLSPEFGLGGSYLATLSGSLPDGSNPARVVPTTQQTLTLGIRYRDFFTRDLSFPYLVWGADYYQYHLSVPQDSLSRADLYTTGAKLSVLGVFPSHRSYAWNLGFSLLPKMYHHEGSNSSGFKSGGHADANAVEFLVGGQWQLSPSSSMFWRVTYQVEKDLFTGDASVPDPSSKTTPNGVSVTNSAVLLQMGYGWGS